MLSGLLFEIYFYKEISIYIKDFTPYTKNIRFLQKDTYILNLIIIYYYFGNLNFI